MEWKYLRERRRWKDKYLGFKSVKGYSGLTLLSTKRAVSVLRRVSSLLLDSSVFVHVRRTCWKWLEENKISPLIRVVFLYIHHEYTKQRKREEEKRSAGIEEERVLFSFVLSFVFEETARENRERREREILCVWSRNVKRKDCKSSERYEENARALKRAL